MRRTVVIMAREPQAGKVKTRLAPTLGPEGAAKLYSAMLTDVVKATTTGSWDTVLAVTPPEAQERLAARFPMINLIVGQEGPDLITPDAAGFYHLLSPRRAGAHAQQRQPRPRSSSAD